MRVLVLGTRGIPNVLGGVETHCENLYPELAKYPDMDITLVNRSCYVDSSIKEFKNVKLKNIYSPRNKTFEAIIHTFLGVIYAFLKGFKIIHIHTVGTNLLTPLARLLGMKVVMTHHGPDYEREKWNKTAKSIIKFGEYCGVKYANELIVISKEINSSIIKMYGRKNATLIENGVRTANKLDTNDAILNRFELKEFEYIFTLGRFVPEKGFEYLINAYKKSKLNDKIKLVIAGDADHEGPFSVALKRKAKDANVILTGFVKGTDLNTLFSKCGLFILPSFYEGLPISLLEAMSFNLPILASNIPANCEVSLPDENYFPVGNEDELSQKMTSFFNSNKNYERVSYDLSKYDWNNIAKKTYHVLKKL